MREKAPDEPLLLYYHGNISPVLLPEAVVEAVRQFGGRVRLLIAGYEAPGAAGYIRQLLRQCQPGPDSPVRLSGTDPPERSARRRRAGTCRPCRRPGDSNDLNIRHLTGASNKAFDYMAAGLALLVSDLPDWRAMFVAPGYALPCNPGRPRIDKSSVGLVHRSSGGAPRHGRARPCQNRRGMELRYRLSRGYRIDQRSAGDTGNGVMRTIPEPLSSRHRIAPA